MGLLGFGGGGDYLAIDFGASALKAGKATVSDNAVQFSLVDNESLLEVSSEEYVDGCIEALEKIIDRNSIPEKQKVLLALPANDVIIRRMELPSMPEDRMAKVIGYEAESHIPFPLDQVVMDHHVISSSEDGYEIILAAIKEDNLNNHLEIIHRSGLAPEVVDVTVFALFNLYTHMWAETNSDDTKPQALVDIGHGNTDIMVFEGETLYFARSASVAGGSLDQAIEKRLEVEPEEARKLKHELGHVPLEGDSDAETPGTSGMDALEQMAAEREQGAEEVEEPDEEAPPEAAEPPPPSGAAEKEEEAPPPPPGEDEPPAPPVEEKEAEAAEEEGGLGGLELGVPASPGEEEPDEEEEAPPEPPPPPGPSPEDEEKTAAGAETGEEKEEPVEEEEEEDSLEGLNLGIPREPSQSEEEEEKTEAEEEEGPPPPPDAVGEEKTKEPEKKGGPEAEDKEEPPAPSEDAEELKLDTAQLEAEKDDATEESGETPNLGQPRKPASKEDSTEGESEPSPEQDKTEKDNSGLDLGGGMLGDAEEEEDDEAEDDDELMGGGLSLGAAAAAEEPEESQNEEKAAAVGEAIKPKMDRLVGELRHTFDYFSSELGGDEISEIILAGGTAKLKNLPEFIADRLDYPVRRLEASEAIEGVEEGQIFENLVAAGLQLRTTKGLSKLNFNLVPDEFIQQRLARERKKKLSVLGVLAAVFVLMLAATAYLQYENRRQVYEQSLEVYGELEPIINRKDELESDRDRIEQRLMVIEELEQDRARILDFLLQLSMLTDPHEGLPMASHTWFDSFRYSEGELTVEGVTVEYEDITTIRNWIEELDYVEEEIGLEWDREVFVVGDEELDMRPFVLRFSMKFEG